MLDKMNAWIRGWIAKIGGGKAILSHGIAFFVGLILAALSMM